MIEKVGRLHAYLEAHTLEDLNRPHQGERNRLSAGPHHVTDRRVSPSSDVVLRNGEGRLVQPAPERFVVGIDRLAGDDVRPPIADVASKTGSRRIGAGNRSRQEWT